MSKTTVIIVGAGGMARHHIRTMLKMQDTTEIVGMVEVSEASISAVSKLYQEEKAGACPPAYDSIEDLVDGQGAPDAAFIITPHSFHLANTEACLKAGIDVLLEKPMVLDEAEAKQLIKTRDETGKLLVVAFPGSLSPAIQKAKQMLDNGDIGVVNSINAYVHQGWKVGTTDTWRQVPEVSGGGFLFDTGSHMINSVVELIRDDVDVVCALMDNRDTPVEINSTVSGRSKNGITFGLTGAGESIHCTSEIQVFGTEGVLKTGIWGERLAIKTKDDKDFKDVETAPSMGVWEQFIKVRTGQIKNPCPAEIGLRFAKLMDMIRQSAESGQTVKAP